MFGIQTRFVSVSLNSASDRWPSLYPYRLSLPPLASPLDCLHPVQVAKVGHVEGLDQLSGPSIKAQHVIYQPDVPSLTQMHAHWDQWWMLGWKYLGWRIKYVFGLLT